MAEKETVFSSNVTSRGIFSFKDFYKFCYDWIMEEIGMDQLVEEKYKERISGDSKEIDVKWAGTKDITDYFRFEIKVSFTVRGLKKVEISNGGTKVQADKGEVRIKVDGILVKDYDGKFESSSFKKFTRGIYEKWVIPSRIDEFKGKIADDCDELLLQAKAYLNLEGRTK